MENNPTQEKVSKVEVIKQNGNFLRGTIEEALTDDKTFFEDENVQQLKFHGVYQQDDRDLRSVLRKEGKEKHYRMMVRARIPGGVLTPEQYLVFDRLADEYNEYGSLRITTRQTIQLHGVIKRNLKPTIQALNEVLVTTLGGCGDQVRNTVCCAAPGHQIYHKEVRRDLLQLVNAVSAKTNAYHEIWLDGEKVPLSDELNEEPLYGAVYLPRKFKLGFAVEGDNCIDVYTNDIGIVAHIDEKRISGYTLLVGGGMGRTASDKLSYPRLATPICFVNRDQLIETVVTIIGIQRDYGNRIERRYARFKYLLDTRGLEWFQQEMESRLNRELVPPRELTWNRANDHLGWHTERVGRSYIGIFVENGRIKDTAELRLKSVLREIVEHFRPTVRLTTQQNIILSDIENSNRSVIEQKLREAGVALAETLSKTKLSAMACVALPTCGLATAESERALPTILPDFERMFQEYGIEDEHISVRMTGCPNGCARPYTADIAFVGRSPGKYDLMLAGDFYGTRLNQLFQELVPIDKLADTVRPIVSAYASEREFRETFGDYCCRVGLDRFRELITKNR
ncbi:NADPH-dependent assimilatory sulfite reductase hemoprotein subunit [Alicyclobacillus fastidiosus]|uniref:NADPH-dependent assimilatory sulfite reductase hemoprotein subunit n=1 Tax=Alicyclobacillus fastidiosus TaxID=392011 RepID=A0ABY6ZJ96_9BACL|nr:NADPH-dependent assimilatory sulfite reductase hemoprotein subunit [Alicyclobacillus fastidiosus]WAH42927.1 NADPH-dependent assimilatory sulfite reductase hemoprotein subunit [Alicyclobacillus fastidiosus]GMA64878.1 sulfite reductase subunit beta [Alicyclobacillus fastidiosus]